MIWSFNVRVIAYLRRAVRALEAIQGSLEVIARCVEDEWREKHARKLGRLKPTEFGSFSVTEANERYHKERQAEMLEPE